MMGLPSLPLLTKELVEQAMRKRTYIARSAYACLLLAIFPLLCIRARNGNSYSYYYHYDTGLLGLGGEIFHALLVLQFCAILALMPVLTAGTLTLEKEQGTLTILLLTDMGPWELLLQKLLSRLVIAGTFVLLGLPLMALAYTYGGVQVEQLLIGPLVLMATSLQIGAVALAMSAWFRSTIGALIGTVVALALLYLGPLLLQTVCSFAVKHRVEMPWYADVLWPGRVLPGMDYPDNPYAPGFISSMTGGWMTLLSEWSTANLGVIISTVLFLLLARVAVLRRSEITQPSLILTLFRALDRLFDRGDRLLGRRGASASLPIDDPIAWRELNRRSFASWRYLLRFLLPTCGGVLVLLSFMASLNVDSLNEITVWSCLVLLALQLLFIVVLAAGVVSTERSHQTLEVLLTTPIDPRTLVLHKMRAVWRISWVMMIPQVIALLIMGMCFGLGNANHYYHTPQPNEMVTAIASHVVYLAILPPQFAWMAVIVGLLVKNRTRSMVIAVICALVWIASVVGIAFLFNALDIRESSVSSLSLFLSPASLPLAAHLDVHELMLFPGSPVSVIALVVIWHGGLWWAARRWCLHHAERLVRRSSAG
jgi:ABC-type transport system involved in multi-copper enzyme maturation permease subunit